MCLLKTSSIIQLLEDELKRLGLINLSSHEDFLKVKKKAFEEIRGKLHRYIDEYMDSIFFSFSNKLSKDFKNVGDVIALVNKIKSRMNNFQDLHSNLKTKAVISAIQKTCKMTAADIMLEFRGDLTLLEKNNKMIGANISINEAEIQELKETLRKIVTLDSQQYKRYEQSQKEEVFETGVGRQQSRKLVSYFSEKFGVDEFGKINLGTKNTLFSDPFSIQEPNSLGDDVLSTNQHYFEAETKNLYLYGVDRNHYAPKVNFP